MPRATDPQKAERLNLVVDWLQQGVPMVEATERLVAATGVSARQAYRYVKEAQNLKHPVPVVESKVPFTVKLSQTLVETLHRYAASTGQTLSEIVSRALWALLKREREGGRG